MNIIEKIKALKEKHKALILAHNYTLPEIQDIADFVGDSLELSRKAAECHAPVIAFCGVRFMAETAKILSPDSIVILPNANSGCPMANMADFQSVKKYKIEHPNTIIAAYVNTTAETKTLVDICCTSGNAEEVLRSIPPDREIMFLPDANLGSNLINKLGRKMRLWPGFCPAHNKILPDAITKARAGHPDAIVLVHPECLPAVVAEADYALSTGGMLKFVRESEHADFIIGTESGIIHRMKSENPEKHFFPIAPEVLCPNMKKITLEDLLFSLEELSNRIELTPEVISAARKPIERMLKTGK